MSAAAGYLAIAFLPLTASAGRLIFYAVPMLLLPTIMGLYRVLRLEGDRVLLQVGAVFAIIGAALLLAMAVVQGSTFHYADGTAPPHDDLIAWVLRSVHAVQLGIDIAFDLFFLAGLGMLALCMTRSRGFPGSFGATGALAALATLILNLLTFPVPPEPDLGPLVGMWGLAAGIRLLWLAPRVVRAPRGAVTSTAVLVVLLVLPADGVAQAVKYADPEARALVSAVRARLAAQQHTLGSYDALVKERLSVSVRLPLREHLVYRREMAARLEWRRIGDSRIHLLGAREYRPRVTGTASVLQHAAAEALDLAFSPDEAKATIGLGSFRFGPHPLTAGDTVGYRFSSGDTVQLVLSDGRMVRLYELRVEPTRRVFPAVIGSLWIDAATHSVVQEIYRPLVAPSQQADGRIPGIGAIELHVERIAIDHGLWEMRWWLPSMLTFHATLHVGRIVRAPFRYERAYSDYELHPIATASADTSTATGTRLHWQVLLPEDRARLLDDPHLPASILDPHGPVGAGDALRKADALLSRDVPQLGGTGLHAAPPTLDLIRFNRVEGLSMGARAGYDSGLRAVEGEVRVSTHARGPDVEITASTQLHDTNLRLSGYRRLSAMQYEDRPLGLAGSMTALLLGHDDGDYYRARGGALAALMERSHVGWHGQVYYEQQRPVTSFSDWSVARLFDGQHVFRPNTRAASARLVGVRGDFDVRAQSGSAGVRGSASVHIDAAAGDHEFARGALVLRGAVPLAGALLLGAELGAGTSAGSLPPQALWHLGGPATLRGYDGARLQGAAFWRGRIELGLAQPFARVTTFYDIAWAGDRETLTIAGNRAAVGLGLSILDGLVRLDFARPLSAPRRVRATFSTGAIL